MTRHGAGRVTPFAVPPHACTEPGGFEGGSCLAKHVIRPVRRRERSRHECLRRFENTRPLHILFEVRLVGLHGTPSSTITKRFGSSLPWKTSKPSLPSTVFVKSRPCRSIASSSSALPCGFDAVDRRHAHSSSYSRSACSPRHRQRSISRPGGGGDALVAPAHSAVWLPAKKNGKSEWSAACEGGRRWAGRSR
jgi:hypothetical protein